MTGRIPRVQLFATCLVDQFWPRAGLATAAVLERLGVTVVVPDGLTCCGQPAFNGGFLDEARLMARHTVEILSRDDAPVVMPSGSCAEMIVHHYPRLLGADPVYHGLARALAARTFEISAFLVRVLGVTDVGATCARRVAYHASCHTLRGLGVRDEPRRLLSRVRHLALCELPEAETCCGFGGLFAVRMPEISGAMLRRKLDRIEASGAEVVVGTDVSCLMHVAGGLRRRGSAITAAHLAEILAGGSTR